MDSAPTSPCPHCNDDGIVCDMEGSIIGPCDCVADDPVLALARAIGLAFGHTFTDVRSMIPGPNTVEKARATLGYLKAAGWTLDSGRSPSSGDASDPIRLHDCGRFHRPSEPCRDGDAS